MAELGDDPTEAPRARAEWEHFDGFAQPRHVGDLVRRAAISAAAAVAALAVVVGLLARV